jgi:hypothetical protein
MKPPEVDDKWELIDDGETQKDLVKLHNQVKNTPQLASLIPANQNIYQLTKHFIAPSKEVVLDSEDATFEMLSGIRRQTLLKLTWEKTLNLKKCPRCRQTEPLICLRDLVGMNFDRRTE